MTCQHVTSMTLQRFFHRNRKIKKNMNRPCFKRKYAKQKIVPINNLYI